MARAAVVVLLGIVLGGCSGQANPPNDATPPNDFSVSGNVQKGPYVRDTTVSIQELRDDLSPNGRYYELQIEDDLGSFPLLTGLQSPYVEIHADGYYYDEVGGALASGTLNLRAIADLSDGGTVGNLNVLTTLEKHRVVNLVAGGATVAEAKVQAQSEILAVFGIDGTGMPASEELNIAQAGDANAALLAISAVLLEAAWQASINGAQVTANLSALIGSVSNDLDEDGTLDDPDVELQLLRAASYVDLEQVRENLETRYAELGAEVTIPSFEAYVDSDGDGIPNGEDDPVPSSVPAGTILMGRYDTSAVLLGNGLVLIAGGSVPGADYANRTRAELFNPVTETSQNTTGNMAHFRGYPSHARVLANGKVLIVGGSTDSNGQAELFDPATGTFSGLTGFNDYNQYVQPFTATALLDGRVLIVRSNYYGYGSEIFDGSDNSYTPTTGSLPSTHGNLFKDHAAVRLLDGRVLIAGGADVAGGVPARHAALFNPADQQWTVLDNALAVARSKHTMTVLADGRVLLAGGFTTASQTTPKLELFVPLTNSFALVDDELAYPRYYHTSTRLPNGHVLIAGGMNGSDPDVSAVSEVFDPLLGRVYRLSNRLLSPRNRHAAVAAPDGSVLLFGGSGTGIGFPLGVERVK